MIGRFALKLTSLPRPPLVSLTKAMPRTCTRLMHNLYKTTFAKTTTSVARLFPFAKFPNKKCYRFYVVLFGMYNRLKRENTEKPQLDMFAFGLTLGLSISSFFLLTGVQENYQNFNSILLSGHTNFTLKKNNNTFCHIRLQTLPLKATVLRKPRLALKKYFWCALKTN